MTITTRSYAGKSDQDSVIELLLACRENGCIDRLPTAFHLRMVLTPGSFLAPLSLDASRDVRLWQEDGKLIGFGMIDLAYWGLLFFARPGAQGRDIEEEIVAWGIAHASERVQELEQERGRRVDLTTRVREDDGVRVELLERHGFTRREDYALRMVCQFTESIPAPEIPAGFTLRHVTGKHELEPYIAMHNEIFPRAGQTVEARLGWMESAEYIPELDLVAVAPDGTLAAFCLCWIDHEESSRSGRSEGWTDPLGTRPAFRRKGLARAIVLEGLRRLRAYGADAAILGVSSANTAALRLYESLGFREIYHVYTYVPDQRLRT